MALGDAYIDVHANTDPFQREMNRGIAGIADDGQKLMNKVGDKWGDQLADATADSLRSHGGDFAKAVSDSTRNQVVETRWGYRDTSSGRFVSKLEDQVEDSFTRMARPGGPFEKLSTGISDAIGAGFNISGRSPLIPLLGIGVGALVAVLVAALQAANALAAVLVSIPALIGAIGLQAGVLMLAFEGVGTAVKGAFAAKNAEELNEALKKLTPAAQVFVRSLLPLRDLFRQIQRSVQQNFFKALGDVVPRVMSSLGSVLSSGLPALATALGGLFRNLGLFFASGAFREFVEKVIPATTDWLGRFGPTFVTLLTTLTKTATATLPFLTQLGNIINYAMRQFSRWMDERIQSGEMQEWLDNMAITLEKIVNLFFSVAGFVTSILDQLDEAGGNEVIDKLKEAFERLSFFIESPVGKKALEGLVNVAVFMIEAFAGLVMAVLSVVAAFEFMGEAIKAFLEWLFTSFLPGVGKAWKSFMEGAARAYANIRKFFEDLPGRIVNALGNLGHFLYEKGRSAIRSLGDGVASMWGWVREKALSIVSAIVDVFPGSPAKEGPLSGRGYTRFRGQRMVDDFITGMESQNDALAQASTATVSQVFNLGGIRQEFTGALPTDQQARAVGAGVGDGLVGRLARRDLRLAVRVI